MGKILVTGGAGFLGSHTSLSLINKGYKVIIIDSLKNSSPIALERVADICRVNGFESNKSLKFIKADLRDYSILKNLFDKAQQDGESIDGVIHFAGLKAVGESVNNPIEYWDANLKSSINLLKAMDAYNCKNIVFSSSATIYGYNKNSLIHENDKIAPINPYGNTKAVIEIFLNDVFKSNPSKWSIANLRYFNPIGAHPSGLIGENPNGIPNNIFPFILKVASGEIDRLHIFGNNWPTHDGTCIRDYIHVMDLAEGHIRVLEYLFSNNKQIVNINLGTGKGTSVKELVETFQRTNNLKVPYLFSERREGDIAKVVADISYAESLLNWKPSLNLDNMCIDGWKWQSLNPSGFKK